ncbi:MAG: tetratricopeptide repeat protein [Chitinispirillaceae bacterium]|nr:tetratricopeptide repeat protein [Chitinispirillaceae bacterium]
MLQVRIRTGILLLLMLLAPLPGADTLRIEWMFENAFEKEYVSVNEAMIVVPSDFAAAMEYYHEGAYRRAADILYRVRRLNLPDGELDFVSFVLAECYRKLGLDAKAMDEYRFVAARFPDTDKRAPALFRLLEYAALEGVTERADSIRALFTTQYRNHPLFNSVLYACGKLSYEQEQYGEAVRLFREIDPRSIRYMQATFMASLCHIRMRDWSTSLSLLGRVSKHARDLDMRTEALIVMGDVHYRKNDLEKALECYRRVPRRAARYEYALVKIARCLFDAGKFEKAVKLGKNFMRRRGGSDYFFEMASILEQTMRGMGRDAEATDVDSRIHMQIVGSRIAFEIFDEIDRVSELITRWRSKEYAAVASRNDALGQWASAGRERSEELQRRLRLFLNEISRPVKEETSSTLPHLAERRYLALLKKSMERIEDTLAMFRRALESTDSSVSGRAGDSPAAPRRDSLQQRYSMQQERYREVEHEHELIITECLGGHVEGRRENEEMQAKFIDWEFMKYLEKKERLVTIAGILAEKRRRNGGSDTLPKALSADSSTDTGITAADEERLQRTINDERKRLIGHIETMIDIYPKSRYAPAILFRLAELRFDDSAERFRRAMAAYEKRLTAKGDTASIPFPEYDLTEAIAVYWKISTSFPADRHADDALYYCALALQKQGLDDSAQAVMLGLIEQYPQSEYYIEANMHIGRHYFENPKQYGGNGYKLAEEAFRNVLFNRDHPKFVQALYHLGWCYYMQDRYDEAITAFNYLVEEVELDFDPLKKEEKEVKNPLLRAEAIDYLAISFDRDRDTLRAAQFLRSIGNVDYAALVFSRMGELREEDLDFAGAIAVYKRLIASYPLSYYAPQAAARLVKLYENAGDRRAVAARCDAFFRDYSAGGEWQKRVGRRDSTMLREVDSMAIAIGLSQADNAYRHADSLGNAPAYRDAAERYRKIVDTYPHHPLAADAAWNLAAILDKIGDKPGAFERFLAFSVYPGVDSARRETAALNAVAIAQSLLSPDSLAAKGSMDFAGTKLLEAVNNYTERFPGGGSFAKVLFTMAGVYFNRRLFDKAADVYKEIVDADLSPEQHFEALLLLGQCRFGSEKWSEAASLFEIVFKRTPVETQKTAAHTFLLQSRYLDAKEMMAKKMYEKAADAFKELDDRFPGSEYGDIALFGAAEAWEKSERWLKACERYFDLVEKYPQSKFAPDALFNAAGDYEKADRFPRAAETYELLVAKYPQSEKAKDALFNLGFCYEKMGKIDAMVAANERYSALYPEEKDVEALLMRSATYYAKMGMFDKAVELYRNFIRRFPQTSKAVEAYYMIGKCQLDGGDSTNASLSFSQTEQYNQRLMREGGAVNHYYASEAAFERAALLHEQFRGIRLKLPETQLKASLKEKSSLLTEAADAYQRVMKYRSEKMFEAACRMGELYVELADDLVEQERPRGDPIKAAIAENEILTAASQVLQNSFVPFKMAIELGAEFDSLSVRQKEWVERSRRRLGENLLQAGTLLYEGVGAMQNAPVPGEILAEPLLHYQYRIKLLETMEPLKMKVLRYFTVLLDSLPKLHLDDSLSILCEIHVARLNYLIGSADDRLATEILKATDNLPKNLSENDREELLFQLEDMVYELQDKAILRLEAARDRMRERTLHENTWYGKIMEALARLNPEKYGASFYVTTSYRSDETWLVREDSVPQWNTAAPPRKGWRVAVLRSAEAAGNKPPLASAKRIGGDTAWRRMYLWKNVLCEGTPRDARIAVSVPGKYKFYVNGILTLSDTAGGSVGTAYDSTGGIASLLKGGDNILACEAGDSLSASRGIDLRMQVLIDTTERFTSSITVPDVAVLKEVPGNKVGAAALPLTHEVADAVTSQKAANQPPVPKAAETMSRREVLAATEEYRRREREALASLRHERLEVQKLRILKAEHEERKLGEAGRKESSPQRTTAPLPQPLPPR